MCFTWNTETIPLCDRDDATKCEPNDFFNDLSERIVRERPILVAIAFQEDAKPGSYFHSHYAPAKMSEIGYRLLTRPRMMGLGKTTVKGLISGKLVVRGLRLSIYCREDVSEKAYDVSTSYYSNNYQYSKGGLAVYITFVNGIKIAFINCHLDFNAASLINYRRNQNYIDRRSALALTNAGFNGMIGELIHKHQPTHAFVMGDLNYRINHNAGARELAHMFLENQNDPDFLYTMYRRYDELRDQMIRQNIYSFEEGVDDKGPTFIPTAKMIKRRNEIITEWNLDIDDFEDIGDIDGEEEKDFVEELEETIVQQFQPGPSWYDSLTNATYATLGMASTVGSAVGTAYSSTMTYATGIENEAKSAIPSERLLRQSNGQNNNGSPTRKVRLANPERPFISDHPLSIEERGNRMWNTGKWDQRSPSWTDRILYGTVQAGLGEIACTYYNRFDKGETMMLSDHAGVLGTYIITKTPTDFVSFNKEIQPINLTEKSSK